MSHNEYTNFFIERDTMILCGTCNKEYTQRGREVTCSIKCKLLSKMTKNENGCWLWTGSKGGPYGKIRFNMKTLSAHKSSYQEFIGSVPPGRWVCHTCDVPSCFNPDHLFLGSPSDNRKDAVKKQRTPVGENNHLSRYSDIQVQEMRALKKEGFSYDRLSRIFGCSITHLCNIVKSKYRKD